LWGRLDWEARPRPGDGHPRRVCASVECRYGGDTMKLPGMARLRLLHLEDQELDSRLLESWLRQAGRDWDIVRVDTRDAFVAALDEGGFSIIVSDYRLPAYDGLQALREAKTRRPEVPFVFFSGNLGEERAIAALKSGRPTTC
jgi:DNA-binding NtrC family response regulator